MTERERKLWGDGVGEPTLPVLSEDGSQLQGFFCLLGLANISAILLRTTRIEVRALCFEYYLRHSSIL